MSSPAPPLPAISGGAVAEPGPVGTPPGADRADREMNTRSPRESRFLACERQPRPGSLNSEAQIKLAGMQDRDDLD